MTQNAKTARSDQHINPGESATRNGTGSPLIAATDAASTEDKARGCTIEFASKQHPFEAGRNLVFVRGTWDNGGYAAFPCDKHGTPLDDKPVPATNYPGGALRSVRFGDAYAKHSGHYRSGYVFDVQDQYLDDILAWLAQAKLSLESRIPQVNKPPSKTAKKDRPANVDASAI